ncbi:MAG TPA: hypothetical protein VHE34_00045 [Puia sp.]|uniref:hypothetical protein n=1 Tax=Puia sp. TaxID=2045100 RepID=UPI002C4C67F7|nr:hypothetical protein [Puia sp.]HVU93575.1 hypothetical protein [Puia sp.]
MVNNTREAIQKTSSGRRKLVLGVGLLSILALFSRAIKVPGRQGRNGVDCAPGNKGETVKMLTQDGRLVEIDKALLASGGKKVSDEELKRWVKR